MPSLHSLGRNELKDEGTITVCNALKHSKFSKLKELVLANNGITATGAASVAAYLAISASLTRLDVSHNPLDRGGQGVKLLRDAVSARQGFTLLDQDND